MKKLTAVLIFVLGLMMGAGDAQALRVGDTFILEASDVSPWANNAVTGSTPFSIYAGTASQTPESSGVSAYSGVQTFRNVEDSDGIYVLQMRQVELSSVAWAAGGGTTINPLATYDVYAKCATSHPDDVNWNDLEFIPVIRNQRISSGDSPWPVPFSLPPCKYFRLYSRAGTTGFATQQYHMEVVKKGDWQTPPSMAVTTSTVWRISAGGVSCFAGGTVPAAVHPSGVTVTGLVGTVPAGTKEAHITCTGDCYFAYDGSTPTNTGSVGHPYTADFFLTPRELMDFRVVAAAGLGPYYLTITYNSRKGE